MQVRSLSREDPLEKKMAAHSSILAWKVLWTEELVGYRPGYSPWSHKELDMAEQLSIAPEIISPQEHELLYHNIQKYSLRNNNY